jgi:hypothetical protein
MSNQSIESIKEQVALMEQSITQLKGLLAAMGAEPSTDKVDKVKKVRKIKAESEDAPKVPNAWMTLIADTVAEMRQSGWPAWTDASGVNWPASRTQTVTDAKGQKISDHVYDGGEHNGKAPSHALGGMKRASFLKGQSDPAAAAKTKAYTEKLAEKRSATPPKVKKAAKAEAKPVKAEVKPMDLSFYPFTYEGKNMLMNDRGDVIEPEEATWAGRLNNGILDTTVAEPTDLENVTMRE